MVSIPPWFDFAPRWRPARCGWLPFQSHLGSILPGFHAGARGRKVSFQSHLGSILPHDARAERLPHRRFQSHLGSILPPRPLARTPNAQAVSIPPWFDFAGNLDWQGKAGQFVFQSYLGSILPAQRAGGPHRNAAFQSHLGSILPAPAIVLVRLGNRVSIPPWFDFALGAIVMFGVAVAVSIPPWFDFARTRTQHKVVCEHRFQSHLGSILPY